MALTLAPSINQPTVTFGSLASGAAASTVISGSPGWLREKRVGAAESSPGAAQSSTADLDLTGSTRYRYPGVPAAIGSPSNAGQYVSTDLQPGAVANSHWPFAVEFDTSSPAVAFRYNAPSANPTLGRILVGGLPITDSVGSATASAGAGYYMLLTFPDSRSRTITVIAGNSTQGRWGGCAVDSGYTITKPTDTLGLMAVISDSYGRGAGGVGTVDAAPWRLAWELGYGRSVCLAAVGGTGINYDGTGTSAASFDGRVAGVMGLNPEVVLIFGGRNDAGGPTLQAAIESLLDAIGPTPLRVVASTASEGSQASVRSSMSAGAASRSVDYIDTTIDTLPKLDAVHPTLDGHKTLADELLDEWPSADITGTLAAAVPLLMASITGESTNPAALAASLPVITGTLTGTAVNPGTLASTLPLLTVQLADQAVNPATLDADLPRLTTAIAGTQRNPATLNGTLPRVTGALTGSTVNTASIDAALPVVTATIAGAVTNPGVLDANLPRLTCSIISTDINPGTLDARLPLATAAIAGTATNPGTLAGVLPKLLAQISDQTVNTGVFNGVLPGATAVITGQSINPATLDAGLPILTATVTAILTAHGSYTTPEWRTLRIMAESRTLAIPAESRTLTVRSQP